jgi:predicted signal transduction protein with EAL and GGDEF domain
VTIKKDQVYGAGMNSLQVRFALMVLVLGGILAIGLISAVHVLAPSALTGNLTAISAVAISLVLFSSAAIYGVSGMLAGQIRELSDIAEQIADGELETEITIECKCDIGGLAISMRKMLSTLRTNLAEITSLAHFDQVTGLPNRLHLTKCLGQRVAQSLASPACSGAILYLDLNGFKQVNDNFGHEAGDKLLAAVSERIIAAASNCSIEENKANALDPERGCKVPVLARFGGDEFILHLPGTISSRELANASEKILAALAQPFNIDGRMVAVGTSIGISRYPADAKDGETLIRNADLAMYAAKQAGKGTYSFFEPGYLEESVAHQELERDLKAAIRAGELEVYYQPKISLSDMEYCGAEALVRWNHPQRGLLGPGSFIEIAESTGIICDLGEFVLRESVRQCAEFARQGKPATIAINVSLAQLQRENFGKFVEAAIRQSGAPPDKIILEITESIASIDIQKIQTQMRPLRALGVRFSIDDFGTGYSNLAKLLNLRFDELKIDRSLISNIKFNRQHREAVRMIVELGSNMGCKVLAEGIETEEQLEAVRTLGCASAQGFLFAKPLCVRDFTKWAAAWQATSHAPGAIEIMQAETRGAA